MHPQKKPLVVKEGERRRFRLAVDDDHEDFGMPERVGSVQLTQVWWADNLWLIGTPWELPVIIREATEAHLRQLKDEQSLVFEPLLMNPRPAPNRLDMLLRAELGCDVE